MRQHRLGCLILAGLFAACVADAATFVLDSAAFAGAHVAVISESATDVVLEFTFGTVELEGDTLNPAAWTSLTIPGATPAARSGWPELPQLSVWVRLRGEHPRCQLLEANTSHRRWGRPRPAAEPVNRSESAVLRRVPASEFYESARLYPEQPVEIALDGRIGNERVVLVTFSPVQCRSNTGEWGIHTRLRARISVRLPSRLDQPEMPSGAARSLLSRLVVNPRATLDTISSTGPRLLVVTIPSYATVLEPFVDWKNRSGVPVLTLFTDGADAVSLRTRIRALCDSLSHSPEFLLLVGDVNIVPPFYGVDASLTDHPYSLLDDSDYLPDLSVGRIPCQGVSDLAAWVERLLAYERDGVLTPNAASTVFASAVALDPQHGLFVRNLFHAAGLTVDRFQEGQNGTLANLMTSLNGGREWIFYIGHGYAQGWSSVSPAFTNSEVAQLVAPTAPVAVSVACATADLDYPGLSLAEAWLALPGRRGPLAYFGATENTAFFRSDTLALGMLRAIYQQQCERLGSAADLGRLATAQCFPQGPGGLTEETIQQFMLLGDPSMRVFSARPRLLSVVVPEILPLAASDLTFSITTAGTAVSGAEVCIASDPPGYYSVGSSGDLGLITIPIQFTQPLLLQWTVTARNAIPAQGTVSIVPNSGPFLQVALSRILDSEGDNDGIADRGESCALQITIRNSGTAASAAGDVRVSCADPRILIGPDTLPFAPLAPRDSVTPAPPIPLFVSDSVNDGDAALLEIRVRTSANDSLLVLRPLTVRAPRMQFSGGSLREDSGDGDGLPEGDERLTLEIRFCNEGGEDLRAPACSLVSTNPDVQITGVQPLAPSVAPGETLLVRATVHVASGMPRGSLFDYAYVLSGENLAPQSGWDVQRIGQVPVLLYVLDLMPQQVDAVAAALSSLGVEYERSTSLPLDLFRYQSVWVFCGVYPNAVALGAGHADRIVQYLNGGGRCYWEGADVWAYDPRTSLHPFFRIRSTNDGSSNAGPVAGEFGTAWADYRFAYAGENSFIDQLAPETGALVMLRNARANAPYAVCIAYAGASYRTIGSSIEIGSLTDAAFPSTRVHLIHDILAWFGIETRADIFPPVIQHVPLAEFPLPNHPIDVIADIHDASGLDSVWLEFRIGGGSYLSVPMTAGENGYVAELPGGPFNATVRYRIRAVDASPQHNASVSPEFSTRIFASADMPFRLVPDAPQCARLRPHINAPEGSSWSLTDYPEGVPVLELHGSASPVTYTTDVFDCSALRQVDLSFYHYLRDLGGSALPVARILGSTDGGLSYPHVAWTSRQTPGGLLEEGTIVVPDLRWASGQSRVALRFEFAGQWYWRLRDIRVTGTTPPVTAPVCRAVIIPVEDGVRLAWPSVTGALYYVISASTRLFGEDAFQPIATCRDTTFLDRDDSYAVRYYQVHAVLEESRTSTPVFTESERSAPADLRLPDLRWNVKLSPRPVR